MKHSRYYGGPCIFCDKQTSFTILKKSVICCVNCYYEYRADAELIN